MSLRRPSAPALPLPPLGSSFTSSLPPPPIHRNRSFARIAQLFGIGSSTPQEDDEEVTPTRRGSGSGTGSGKEQADDDDDEGDSDEADAEGFKDEMTLLLDAQAALISHQPSIASQYYAAAALPPYRSPAACLALANLLLRGSGLAPSDFQSDIQTQDKGKGKARANSVVASPISPIVFARRTSKDSATSVHAQPVAVPVKSAAQRIFGFWRGSTSPPNLSEETSSVSAVLSPTSPSDRRGYDLVATGWAIPREGKRAVRDVEGMGIAGGWLVLGIAWIVDRELEKERRIQERRASRKAASTVNKDEDFVETEEGTYVRNGDVHEDDDALVFGRPKGKGKAVDQGPQRSGRSHHVQQGTDETIVPTHRDTPTPTNTSLNASRSASAADLSATSSASSGEKTSLGTKSDSTMLQTPMNASGGGRQSNDSDPEYEEEDDAKVEQETLDLLFDLVSTLLRLYRHGHIQAADPVALPPIASSNLPGVLRPQGDAQKARNVWRLGVVVARKLLELHIVGTPATKWHEEEQHDAKRRNIQSKRTAVEIMANYVLGMTAVDGEAERYFREIVSLGPTGHEYPDELVRQAAARLDIIQRTPGESPLLSKPSPKGNRIEYPFPKMMTPIKPPADATPSQPRRIATVSGGMPSIRPSPKRPTGHSRQTSIASFQSNFSASGIIGTTVKSSVSLASLTVEDDFAEAAPPSKLKRKDGSAGSAIDLLRRLREKCDAEVAEQERKDGESRKIDTHGARWPSLAGWTMGSPSPPASAESSPPSSLPKVGGVIVGSQCSGGTVRPPARRTSTIVPIKADYHQSPDSSPRRALHVAQRSEDLPPHLVPPVLRTIASSPQFPTFPTSNTSPPSGSGASTPRRRLPFEPDENLKIAPIDPTLAAAEMASALTKHVVCGVCGAEGVNFPNCRKCGLTFCSRDCRVGDRKAGNGKKHVCGAWESRKLLTVPTPAPRKMSRRLSRSNGASNGASPIANASVKAH